MNKLILADVDMTLIPKGSEVATPDVVEAINEWHDDGNLLVPVTSRTATLMNPLHEQVGLRGMGILDGGATTYNFATGEVNYDLSRHLGAATTKQIVELLAPYCGEVYYGDLLYEQGVDITDPASSIFAEYDNTAWPQIKKRLKRVARRHKSIEYPPRTNRYEGSLLRSCVQIVQPGVDKGSGIRSLLKTDSYTSIDPSNIMVMGDGTPDLDAFKAAPKGALKVAVGDNSPELCQAADWQVPSASKDGAKIAIREFMAA